MIQKILLAQTGHKMASRLVPAVFTHASSAAQTIQPLENTFDTQSLSVCCDSDKHWVPARCEILRYIQLLFCVT